MTGEVVPVDPFAQIVNAPVAPVEVHDRRPPRLRVQPHPAHQLVTDRVAHERQFPAVSRVTKQQPPERADPQFGKKTVIECALPVPIAGVEPQRLLVVMPGPPTVNPHPNGLPDRPSAIWLEPLEKGRPLPLALCVVAAVNAMVYLKKIPGCGGERHNRKTCRLADQITRRDHRPRQMAITKNTRANHRRLGQVERHGEAFGLRPGHGAVKRVVYFALKTRRRNLQGDRSGVHAGRLGQAWRTGPTGERLGHIGRSRGRPRK